MSPLTQLSPPSPARPAIGLARRFEWQPAVGGFAKQALIYAQLALVLAVAQQFRIESSSGFTKILPLLFAGFVVHSLLPLKYRPPFFLALSFAAIWVVLGSVFAVAVVGIGLFLIAMSHLPIAFGYRVVLVLVTAAALMLLRGEWIQTGWAGLPTVVLPVVGSMFMFRLGVYLYDLRHENEPVSIWERISYFFMLPNVCFPLFPVVDYQTFRRCYYNAEANEIYQKGILWICRGATHLLLYRLIYYHLLPSSSEVVDLAGVVQYMVATYLLYLRISGQFHLIIGIMCLFGFNLPETHHLYYLASSFSDYWRRINIYWKDFMMKMFYYPSMMRLRRWGMTPALVLSTVIVFLGTWLLHSYQWFWLRGTFPLTAPDALFWGILGGLVVVNTVSEMRRGRKRTLGKQGWSLSGAVRHSLKVLGMFLCITVLWTLWSSPSVESFISVASAARASGAMAWVVLVVGLALLVAVGVLFQYAGSRGWRLSLGGGQPDPKRSALFVVGASVGLLLLAQPELQIRLGGPTSQLLASLQESRLNEQDQEQLERGYYEGLLNVDRVTSGLAMVQAAPRDWVALQESDIVRMTEDALQYDLIASYDGTSKNAPFRTNRWGMRDRDYSRKKPPGTYRIAMMGSSYAMGAGVDDNQTFEAVVEEQLNRAQAGATHGRYEMLNFAVGGYSVTQNLIALRRKVFAFNPDAVFLVLHTTEATRLKPHLYYLAKSYSQADPHLAGIFKEAGIRTGMKRSEALDRLQPFADTVISFTLKEFASTCREHGVPAVAVLVPTTEESETDDSAAFKKLHDEALDAGFAVLDLDDAYRGHDAKSIQLAGWDTHPNVEGHRLIADEFYRALVENDSLLGLGLVAPNSMAATGHPASIQPLPN